MLAILPKTENIRTEIIKILAMRNFPFENEKLKAMKTKGKEKM
jgi:hypothetical protein